jgi:hypothetical protein
VSLSARELPPGPCRAFGIAEAIAATMSRAA